MESPDTVRFVRGLGLALCAVGTVLLLVAACSALAVPLKFSAVTSLALLLYGFICAILGGFFVAYANTNDH